jgi:hypothetical protein
MNACDKNEEFHIRARLDTSVKLDIKRRVDPTGGGGLDQRAVALQQEGVSLECECILYSMSMKKR